MTTEEKLIAFDMLVTALTNRWHDGMYSANCTSLVNTPLRATAEECVPDIVTWAERIVKAKAKLKPQG